MRYKLMMCGFSAVCEDMDEVLDRLKVIPVERAKLESYECYVFDKQTGAKYAIIPTDRGWVVEDMDSVESSVKS